MHAQAQAHSRRTTGARAHTHTQAQLLHVEPAGLGLEREPLEPPAQPVRATELLFTELEHRETELPEALVGPVPGPLFARSLRHRPDRAVLRDSQCHVIPFISIPNSQIRSQIGRLDLTD